MIKVHFVDGFGGEHLIHVRGRDLVFLYALQAIPANEILAAESQISRRTSCRQKMAALPAKRDRSKEAKYHSLQPATSKDIRIDS